MKESQFEVGKVGIHSINAIDDRSNNYHNPHFHLYLDWDQSEIDAHSKQCLKVTGRQLRAFKVAMKQVKLFIVVCFWM